MPDSVYDKRKISFKIVCIGAKSKEGNPVSIMGIPVCELKELKSYREKYLFVIATLEHTQERDPARTGGIWM